MDPTAPKGRLFEDLFTALNNVGYRWEPRTPDQITSLRKRSQEFSAIFRHFGLGLEVSQQGLEQEGIPAELAAFALNHSVRVSSIGERLFAHHAWPPSKSIDQKDFVYFGRESLLLTERLLDRSNDITGKKILDLGCGSGCLLISIAPLISRGLGVDISESLLGWANANAEAHGVTQQIEFKNVCIGDRIAEQKINREFDVATFNPPLVIQPEGTITFSYRDGGELGVGLPLLFLDFAEKKLVPNGKVFCLMTNPIDVSGRPVLLDRIKAKGWRKMESEVIEPEFDSKRYHEDWFKKLKLKRIELVFLGLERS